MVEHGKRLGFVVVAVLSCIVSLLLSTTIASAHSTLRPLDLVWNVHVDHYRLEDVYNGYSPEYTSEHYLVVSASFQNLTSEVQILTQPLFALNDDSGNSYDVTAHSTQQTYLVDPFSTVATETAFIVPRSTCVYSLTLLNSVSGNDKWSISDGC